MTNKNVKANETVQSSSVVENVKAAGVFAWGFLKGIAPVTTSKFESTVKGINSRLDGHDQAIKELQIKVGILDEEEEEEIVEEVKVTKPVEEPVKEETKQSDPLAGMTQEQKDALLQALLAQQKPASKGKEPAKEKKEPVKKTTKQVKAVSRKLKKEVVFDGQE